MQNGVFVQNGLDKSNHLKFSVWCWEDIHSFKFLFIRITGLKEVYVGLRLWNQKLSSVSCL